MRSVSEISSLKWYELTSSEVNRRYVLDLRKKLDEIIKEDRWYEEEEHFHKHHGTEIRKHPLEECFEACDFRFESNLAKITWNGPFALDAYRLEFFKNSEVVWAGPLVGAEGDNLIISVLLVADVKEDVD